ncbi:hypothetical protein HMPREF1551_01013 [Capnocytophaga sp. oral taxon 863 str. F0517]|nr:hypothetical protein HMPREF1551_01013 [Capnocytophaga sp. oral taxon 863 str. F0517]
MIKPEKASIASNMPVPQLIFISLFFESKITTKKGIITHKSIDFFDSNTLGSEK